MPAPGAEDDGSGTMAILETLRVLVAAGFRPKRTVEFHWYAAEVSFFLLLLFSHKARTNHELGRWPSWLTRRCKVIQGEQRSCVRHDAGSRSLRVSPLPPEAKSHPLGGYGCLGPEGNRRSLW